MSERGTDLLLHVLVVCALAAAVIVQTVRLDNALERVNRQPASGVTETNDAPVLLPSCYEDEALVGAGEFEHGRWTSYVCGGAVDDYKWGDE